MSTQRSGWRIAMALIGMVRPFAWVMVLAIGFGMIGHLAAIAIPAYAAWWIVSANMEQAGGFMTMAAIFLGLGILRALCHYFEQLANHYLAFRILAVIRDHIYRALRRLAPAKLMGKDSGTLISLITTDIELLEVFYAHTISPVAIAIGVEAVVIVVLGSFHHAYAVVALLAYLALGVVVPFLTEAWGKEAGAEQRRALSKFNAILLDIFRGIRESIQFSAGERQFKRLQEQNGILRQANQTLARVTGRNSSLSLGVLLIFDLIFLLLTFGLYQDGQVDMAGVLFPAVLFLSSFGPVLALASLANNLLLTFACGDRVLNLLAEEPVVAEVVDKPLNHLDTLAMDNVSFRYSDKKILDDWTLALDRKSAIGLSGPSGSGKSTALALLMRFYDPSSGEVRLNDQNLSELDTASLRRLQASMSQQTHLFCTSLRENVRLARLDATDMEVEEACRQAAIHDVIMGFPDGYDTYAGDLGDRLSAGERQRIGLARAFLHGGDLLLLDEPTANIDGLNEKIILKKLRALKGRCGMVLVSHRPSTFEIVDRILRVEDGKLLTRE